jgi:hypothetical protein
MSMIKNEHFTLTLLGSLIPFALIIWILVSPVSLIFKIAHINMAIFAIFILFTGKDKRKKIKTITTIWAVAVTLLFLLHLLEATGRL